MKQWLTLQITIFQNGFVNAVNKFQRQPNFKCEWNSASHEKCSSVKIISRQGRHCALWGPKQSWSVISIGNRMISSDIWHKYHKWYFKIVIRNFTSRKASEIWDSFEISWVVFMPNITYKSCYYLRYFKLSWNTTALSQSNCRNFSCSGIIVEIESFCLCNFMFPSHVQL